MEELINTTFESGKLPDDWAVERRGHHFISDALHSGPSVFLWIPIPGMGWNKLLVECEVEVVEGAVITCGDGIIDLVTNLTRGIHRMTMCELAVLARCKKPVSVDDKIQHVKFSFENGNMSISINGEKVIEALEPRPRPMFGLLKLGFWDNCLVHRIRISGDGALKEPVYSYPARRLDDFHLEVAVDFADDLLYAAWTPEMFEQAFAEFKKWGVKRCHWIYYGGSKDGWWDNLIGVARKNAIQTFKNAGEFFPAAVRAAHAQGIEIYALLKPFDMGIFHTFGEETPQAVNAGKLPRIGGAVYWIADFPVKHQDWIMSRKPGAFGAGGRDPFTRIDLVKEDESPADFSVGDVHLYVSDDNNRYRIYEGPVLREEIIEDYPVWEQTSSGGKATERKKRVRVMRFKNLNICQKYVAVSVSGRTGSFSNTFVNLIHVFDENQEVRLLTYGILPRRVEFEALPTATPLSTKSGFQKVGVEFDVVPDIPTAIFPGYEFVNEPYSMDSRDGFIAIARGKEKGPVAALSPSFPEVRHWWLSLLKESLEAGADGIDLRVRSHNYNFSWSEFGFEKPIRDEFLKRYGVDLWLTDDFDKSAWRQLRGEAYTEFCREAKKLAGSYGKPMSIHISPSESMDPGQGSAMDIHWNWRTWLDEKLPDSVTMKEILPGTRLAEEVLFYARRNNIPLVLSTYGLNIWKNPNGEKVCEDWIRLAKNHGFDGYQYYESAAVLKGDKQGNMIMEYPALRALFHKTFVDPSSKLRLKSHTG